MSRSRLPIIVRPGGRIYVGDDVELSLQRTLRIPDDGRVWPLPPGFGAFPVERADDDTDRLLVPIHQSEALWLSFGWMTMPHAIKVGVGGVDAISGRPFDATTLSAEPQDYLVVPDQPWLDGINAGDGFIRQFVATALGDGHTVGEQLGGDGTGLHIVVIPPKRGRFEREVPRDELLAWGVDAEMGIGAGGRMRQEIFPDEHGIASWDLERATTIDLRLCNSASWRQLTGHEPPPTPVDVRAYVRAGLPWFELYSERGDLEPSEELGRVRSLSG